MTLTSRIIRRVSAFLFVILTLWSVLFYLVMMDEITDEVDDAIDLYAENVITRYLAGKELPDTDNGTNNSYHINRVTEEYARTHPHFSYTDETLYIADKHEAEPARVMKTIFRNSIGEWMELTVITPTIEKKDLMESIAYWILGLYLAVVITIIVVNAWVIRRSMRPLYRLLGWLDRYNINEQADPIDNPTTVTEFQTLNDAIQRFSQRNHELFEQQKRFIGDASHELQTPIAICLNRLEMLCDTDLGEEQMGEVIKTLQTLEHMSELNRSLLLLSKIDNHQYLDTVPVDMAALVHQTQNEYRRMAAERKVKVTIEETCHLVWTMNPTLAKILVHNLYRNALVHNLAEGDGELHIYIGTREMAFSNTGAPVALDEEHIFDRFYKEGGREGSSGLGLAIVKAICDTSDLSVGYDFVERKHRFVVGFFKRS
ncbi:MAG: HAMP domain-containing histidine kinase [Bacteroidaceae bacterium]|nr:HAMP domain-containing histidine kinase [Bacteroidaceae bacterium]